MSTNHHFGPDIGRGNCKIVFGASGEKDIVIPSYCLPYRDIDIKDATGGMLDNLIVEITRMDLIPVGSVIPESSPLIKENLIVGDLARINGGTREFQKDKATHPHTIPLLATMLALAAASQDIYSLEPRVCLSLPINDYNKQAQAFEKSVQGNYSVLLPNGKRIFIHITPENVISVQEGVNMIWDMLLDHSGELINLDLAVKTICLIEIGWKTLNFAVMNKLKPDDSMSGTLSLGLCEAFKEFYKRISRERDISLGRAEMLFLDQGKPEIAAHAKKVLDQLSIFLPFRDFDITFLGGAGGKTIAPAVKDMGRDFKLLDNPITAGASGNYKLAKYLLK